MTETNLSGALMRETLIDCGALRPARPRANDGLTRYRNALGLPVIALDDLGRKFAAQRVALGKRGIVDNDDPRESRDERSGARL